MKRPVKKNPLSETPVTKVKKPATVRNSKETKINISASKAVAAPITAVKKSKAAPTEKNFAAANGASTKSEKITAAEKISKIKKASTDGEDKKIKKANTGAALKNIAASEPKKISPAKAPLVEKISVAQKKPAAPTKQTAVPQIAEKTLKATFSKRGEKANPVENIKGKVEIVSPKPVKKARRSETSVPPAAKVKSAAAAVKIETKTPKKRAQSERKKEPPLPAAVKSKSPKAGKPATVGAIKKAARNEVSVKNLKSAKTVEQKSLKLSRKAESKVENKVEPVLADQIVKPVKKKIKPIGSAVVRGKMGRYDFEMFSLDAEIKDGSAIYVISKRITDKSGRGHHKFVCIGQSESLLGELKKHKKDKCIKQHNANVICLLREEDEKNRLKIETDLREAHTIFCNQK